MRVIVDISLVIVSPYLNYPAPFSSLPMFLADGPRPFLPSGNVRRFLVAKLFPMSSVIETIIDSTCVIPYHSIMRLSRI